MYKKISIDELSKSQKESLSDIANSNYLNNTVKINLIEDVFQGKIIHFMNITGDEFQPLSSIVVGDSASGMASI